MAKQRKPTKKAAKKKPKKTATAPKKKAATPLAKGKAKTTGTIAFTHAHTSLLTVEKSTALMQDMRALLDKHELSSHFQLANVQMAPATAMGLRTVCDNCAHPRWGLDEHGNLVCLGCDD